MVSVKVVNASKKFDGKKVLDNVTFEVKDGSFTSILGPVGAGKTTLLRIIAGVEFPDNGSIYFGDKDVTMMPAKERNVAMVYQTFALYPHMKVFDNIASPLAIRGIPKTEIEKRVKEVAELLKIDHLLSRYPRELSGGEAQRVAIARALIKKADVYLFDEPLTNLDYKIRESMRGELRRIFRELGGTIIYAASDPLDTFTMAQYVVILHRGKVLQTGTVEEVYSNPKNVDVSRILARPPMNLIDAELKIRGDKYILDMKGVEIDVSHLKDLLKEKEYIVGIRPEHLFFPTGEERKVISFPSTVIVTEIEGSESIIHLNWEGYKLMMYYPYIKRLAPGERMIVSAKLKNLYIFSKKNGELIARYSREVA